MIELSFDKGGQGFEFAGRGLFEREESVGDFLYSVCWW
jgi:hypothetical protein